jgi:Ca2+-binding EF-hand superfamily protein
VHDAFTQFDGEISRDRSLARDEFAVALGRLGFSAAEAQMLFAAMDADRSGFISLTEFLDALVNVSSDALLWELRCRLDSVDIRPSNLQKAFQIIHMPWPAAAGCGASPGARGQPRLGHTSWLKFCAHLGLTMKDSQRLFTLMDTDSNGYIDLREMFKALRAVASETSLEGLVGKIFTQYGSSREAFSSHAKDGFMGYEEFFDMASTLDVSDDNVVRLWKARLIGERFPDETGDDAPLTEEAFEHLMMTWAPDTSVQDLRQELATPTTCGVTTSGKNRAACNLGSVSRKGRSARSGPGRRQRRHLVHSSPL